MKNDQQIPTCSELALSNDGAKNDTNRTLPMLELFSIPKEWPQEIIVEPARLASGIWGDNEGDINAAYCADTLPQVKAFTHEGQLFINCGGSENSVACYPLMPLQQRNVAAPKPYSHEGELVKYKTQPFTLGPKIMFTGRARTLEEETSLLRRKYGYGGHFAAGKIYRAVLLEFLDRYGIRQGEKTAIDSELAQEELPKSQQEMLAQLGKSPGQSTNSDSGHEFSQSTLPGL